MRLNLCLILSMFKVAWFLTSSYYWIVNLKQKTLFIWQFPISGHMYAVNEWEESHCSSSVLESESSSVAHVLVPLSFS